MKHGTIKKTASKFGLHRNTISLIWNRIQQKIREGRTDFNLSPRKKVTNGPKSKKLEYCFGRNKKFLLTKDLLLDHYLLQQTFQ